MVLVLGTDKYNHVPALLEGIASDKCWYHAAHIAWALSSSSPPLTPGYKAYLVIAGSHPPPTGLEHLDHREVEAICKVLEVEYDSNFKLTRLKKKDPNSKQLPLMRLEFENPNSVTRSGLPKNAKKLCGHARFRDIYIRPDLNNAQIERNRIVVAELKRRRGLGHNVMIGKNGKVIERS